MDEVDFEMKKMAKRVFDRAYNLSQDISVNAVRPIHLDPKYGLVTSFIPTPSGLVIAQACHDKGGRVVEVALTQELIDILDEVVCRFNGMWRSEEPQQMEGMQEDVSEEVETDDLADLLRS